MRRLVVVEKLRAHVERVLDEFDPSQPVQKRAEVLQRAVDDKSLGETLNLLVLAEESLNHWQRLRIARVRDVEPQHCAQVVEDAQNLLAAQVAADGLLCRRAVEVLETYRRTKAIDGFRRWSVRDIATHSERLREDLDAFARARRHQLAHWEELPTPKVGDAASRVLAVAGDQTDRALEAASGGLSKAYSFLARESGDARAAIRRRIASDRGKDEAQDGHTDKDESTGAN